MEQLETKERKHDFCCFWAICFFVWIGIGNIYLERSQNATKINKDFKLPVAGGVTEKQVELPSDSKLNLKSHGYKMAFSYIKEFNPALVSNGSVDPKYFDLKVALYTI